MKWKKHVWRCDLRRGWLQKTNGAVHILALVEQADFVAWGGVQATMEAEALIKL